jgi:hypothetical protein
MMEKAPDWIKIGLVEVNQSKHFGDQWPKTLCETWDETDREEYLEHIDFEALVDVASSLRNGMPCEIINEYLGHYNLVYYIEFEDTLQWVARIPLIHRHYICEDEALEETVQQYLFKSMIAAHTFARMKKSVFAPGIHASFVNGDNPVGVPFVLMQHSGEFRLDETIGHMHEAILRPVFSDLAREMVSLASPPYFTQIGSIRQNGEEYQVGPMLSQPSLQDEPVEMDKRGPYSTVEEYFISTLNRHISTALRDQNRALYLQSIRLRALIPHFIDPRFNSGPFILAPFDWDARDIFFSDDLEISGIIDWDYATIVPLQSFFRYPPFMTRDWITGIKSSIMENYRRLFRECLGELQDETELPLLELLNQSRWFQMLDEGIQSSELGRQALPVLEAFVAAASNKMVEVKPIPVVKVMPVLKDVVGVGGKG